MAVVGLVIVVLVVVVVVVAVVDVGVVVDDAVALLLALLPDCAVSERMPKIMASSSLELYNERSSPDGVNPSAGGDGERLTGDGDESLVVVVDAIVAAVVDVDVDVDLTSHDVVLFVFKSPLSAVDDASRWLLLKLLL